MQGKITTKYILVKIGLSKRVRRNITSSWNTSVVRCFHEWEKLHVTFFRNFGTSKIKNEELFFFRRNEKI